MSFGQLQPHNVFFKWCSSNIHLWMCVHLIYICRCVSDLHLWICVHLIYIWGDFLSHKKFLLQHDKIRIYDPPKRVLDNLYSNNFFTHFRNIGFVAPGFEASKFLHKCEPPLWSIVNCRKLTIYDWPLRLTFTGFNIYVGIWILQILVLQNQYFENM